MPYGPIIKQGPNEIFTIYNGATTYRTMTFSNVTLAQMHAPYPILDQGKRLWICNGFAEDLVVTTSDLVANDFYKD